MLIANVEYVVNGIFGYSIDGESFSRTSLAIRKARHNSILKDAWQKVAYRKLVHVLRVLVFIKCVVERKVDIADIFRYTIYFLFGLVNSDFGITDTYRVHDAQLVLFVEQRPFTHTDAYSHLRSTDVIQGSSNLGPVLVNHDLVISIRFWPTGSNICFLPLLLI